jgi:YtkA-like
MKIVTLAVLMLAPAHAWACTPTLEGKAGAPGKMLNSKTYNLVFRTLPEKIVIGKHFAVELAYCAKDNAPAAASVRVDAHMPEHRHGMNYKTVVTSIGGGHYRAEGLMFHMPGRWEYIFELRAADGAPERLTASMVLQ